MRGFSGGSPYSMARDIAEGFVLVNERVVMRMRPPDVDSLAFEIQRYLRELRGGQSANDPVLEVQRRNRRIQKLNGALAVVRSCQIKRRS